MPITKLVCLGDSLTEGYNIDMSQRWTELLKKEVVYPIINSGISGDTTTGMLSRFRADVYNHRPSHVIILGGTNDLYHRLNVDQIISNIHAMSRQAKYYQIEVIIGIPTPIIIDENEHIAQSFFVDHKQLKEDIETYSRTLKAYAKEDGKNHIDFSKDMTSKYFLADGVHPNELGQSLIMKNVLKTLSLL